MNNVGIKCNGLTGIDFGATSVKACVRTQNGLSAVRPNGSDILLSEISVCKSGMRPGMYQNSYFISNIKEDLAKVDSNGWLLKLD